MKIILAGGTGYLGKLLQSHYHKTAHEVVVFSRSERTNYDNIKFIQWDATHIRPEWTDELYNADVLINLCGRTVNCRYNEKNKKEIIDSRVKSTAILGKALHLMKNKLRLWINFSSATIYRHSLDKDMTESKGEIGTGFSVEVCKAWEKAFYEKEHKGIRKVALRLAMVMGKEDGPLVPLLGFSKIGLGGKMGKGEQYVSWLSEIDYLNIIDLIIANNQLQENINCCSPNPKPNSEFMADIRKAYGVRFGLNLRSWMLKIGAFFMGTETELITKSRRVVPERLLEAGYKFVNPEFGRYVKELVNKC